MRRSRWAPAAVLLVGAAEIMAFVGLSQLIGTWLTLLLVVVVSLLGLVLVRREGLRAWRGFRQAAAAGAPPGPQVTDGVVGLGGALLLATPGLVTGVAGAALLTPPVRALARSRVQMRAERRMSSAQAGEVFGPRRVRVQREPPAAEREDDVVEGEIVDER
ncbi:MAG: FxsA family protein [Micromonosporaceae bacterium]|nr:FxsA family protein [Micromonosporaceae bacterium]